MKNKCIGLLDQSDKQWENCSGIQQDNNSEISHLETMVDHTMHSIYTIFKSDICSILREILSHPYHTIFKLDYDFTNKSQSTFLQDFKKHQWNPERTIFGVLTVATKWMWTTCNTTALEGVHSTFFVLILRVVRNSWHFSPLKHFKLSFLQITYEKFPWSEQFSEAHVKIIFFVIGKHWEGGAKGVG